MRVCGLLEREGKLLLARHQGIGSKGHLWLPPGGGLEFGESIADCLVREFMEECCLQVQVGSFYRIHEVVSLPLHAVELFYRVSIPSGEPVLGADPEKGEDVPAVLAEIRWFSKEGVLSLPEGTVHSVALQWASA